MPWFQDWASLLNKAKLQRGAFACCWMASFTSGAVVIIAVDLLWRTRLLFMILSTPEQLLFPNLPSLLKSQFVTAAEGWLYVVEKLCLSSAVAAYVSEAWYIERWLKVLTLVLSCMNDCYSSSCSKDWSEPSWCRVSSTLKYVRGGRASQSVVFMKESSSVSNTEWVSESRVTED